MKTVVVSYGLENGFNKVIDLASVTLGNVNFIQEKKWVQRHFDKISKASNNYCFGVNNTMIDCQQGAVEILIELENMDPVFVELENRETGEEVIKILSKVYMLDLSNFVKKTRGLN